MKTTVLDIGDNVQCDWCNTDYTNSDEIGGFLFGSYGTCPHCADDIERRAKETNESQYIRERARPGETFKAFCLRMRGGDNTVRITTLER